MINIGTIANVTANGAGDLLINYGSIGGALYIASGTLTNGSATDTTASIGGVAGISQGILTNFGTLGGAIIGAGGSLMSGAFGQSAGLILGEVEAMGSLASVTNFGTIIGAVGVYMAFGSGPLTDAGAITGTSGLAIDFVGGSAHLILDAGASINGLVSAGGAAAANLLELGAVSGPGSVAGLGTVITNFGSIAVDAGANWSLAGSDSLASGTTLSLTSGATLSATGTVVTGHTISLIGDGVLAIGGGVWQFGSGATVKAGEITVDVKHTLDAVGTLASAIVDNGRVNAGAGTLTVTGATTGRGTIGIDALSVLNVSRALDVQSLSFLAGGQETLVLGRPNSVTATLGGFGASSGNVIDLVGISGTAANFSNGVLAVSETGGGLLILKMSGHYQSNQFVVASDHHGGTNVAFV